MVIIKVGPTIKDLFRSLSLLANINLTASWGCVRTPMSTPSRNVVTTVSHSLELRSAKLVHPLNSFHTPRSPGGKSLMAVVYSPSSAEFLVVTPPK